MIQGIGTDIVNIKRIETIIIKFGQRFIKRIFTIEEIFSNLQLSLLEPSILEALTLMEDNKVLPSKRLEGENRSSICEKQTLDSIKLESIIAFIAKRFAAKEAFAKAVGLGIGKLSFRDIAIFSKTNKVPFIKLSLQGEKLVKEHLKIETLQIHLSLSDDYPYAVAFVIVSN